jgi:tetratricopeptide (TPR) repeat protein
MTENVQEKVVEAYHIAAKGSFDHARMILEETLYDHPNSIEAWLLLADLAENSEEARQCYQMVLEINPNDWVAQQRLKLLFSQPEPELVSTLPLAQAEEPEDEDLDVIPQSFFDELMEEHGDVKKKELTLKESFQAHRKLVLSVGGGVLAVLALGAITWVLSVGYIAWKMGYLILGG